jgi:hypothetical protein
MQSRHFLLLFIAMSMSPVYALPVTDQEPVADSKPSNNLKGRSTSKTLEIESPARAVNWTSEFPGLTLSVDVQDCQQQVRGKFRWAHWVIMFGVIFLLCLIILPIAVFSPCLGPAGRGFWVGALLIMIVGWLLIAVLADGTIYDIFDYTFRGMIC